MKRFKWLKIKRTRVALILALGMRFILPAAAQETPAKKSSVEVVFVLDTTGSMGSLLEGAKQRIWSIANEIAKGKPAPKIKMGLVAYRDRGDQYVTKTFDLTGNLDNIYKELLALQAGGGGDGPEHVLKGLEDAVDRISWSEDRGTFKVLYLVGDAPAHTNYGDTPTMEALAQRALRKGVIINTIQCGTDGSTTTQWTQLASLGEGKFLPIPQNGGVAAVATPFDERMSELNRKLDSSMLVYGKRKDEARRGMMLASAISGVAAPAAAADRAAYKAMMGFDSELDLAQAVSEKKVDLKNIPVESMPEPLRALNDKERGENIQEVLSARKKIAEEIKGLSLKRAQYIEKEGKTQSKDSFDSKLVGSLKEQAALKGIAY